MAFKMKGWSPFKQEDNPDVYYRERTKSNLRGGTTTIIKGDAYSDIEGNSPGAGYPPLSRKEMLKEAHSGSGRFTHVPRQPYIYKGKESDVSIWQHRLKSKTDKSGDVIKRKEKVIYDEGHQMKKVKQRKVKFGKHKGKIKKVTIHKDRGKKTKTKTYSDKADVSPILKRKKY